MASAASPTEFPIVQCAVCDADGLGWLDLDEHDREVTRCLECSTIADAATTAKMKRRLIEPRASRLTRRASKREA